MRGIDGKLLVEHHDWVQNYQNCQHPKYRAKIVFSVAPVVLKKVSTFFGGTPVLLGPVDVISISIDLKWTAAQLHKGHFF